MNLELKSQEIKVEDIPFDSNSRDDIPKLLRGLQHIYINALLRDAIIKELTECIPKQHRDLTTITPVG